MHPGLAIIGGGGGGHSKDLPGNRPGGRDRSL